MFALVCIYCFLGVFDCCLTCIVVLFGFGLDLFVCLWVCLLFVDFVWFGNYSVRFVLLCCMYACSGYCLVICDVLLLLGFLDVLFDVCVFSYV